MKKKTGLIIAAVILLAAVIVIVAISCGRKGKSVPVETTVSETVSETQIGTAADPEETSGEQDPEIVGDGDEAEIIIPEGQEGEGF